MNNIESITSKITADAKEQAQQRIEQAKQEAQQILQDYQAQAQQVTQQAQQQAAQQQQQSQSNGRTVYITPTGKRYHYDNNCNGGTYIPSTLAEAQAMGLTPCKKCAGG